MTEAILVTGSNMGDGAAMLEQARRLIELHAGRIISASGVHTTEPWGQFRESAPEFANQALMIETELTAFGLLAALQRIERSMGRRPRVPEQVNGTRIYENRTIDIDIIFYGHQLICTPELTVPHPHMAEREFVLAPIAEIAPLTAHPQSGKTVTQMLEDLRMTKE